MELSLEQLMTMIGELYVENKALKIELAKSNLKQPKKRKNDRHSGSSPEAG